mmetsp:Transcript_4370/g.9425  ORF Transcript_4370/g.9425 Transcript_4370/m.9425 type:complete len:249 (-) Transcript_4370:333-1079(-)
MTITAQQSALLTSNNANYTVGLTSSEASHRRNNDDGPNAGLNTVKPPINCPKWVCCLLPCIKYIPSVKLFKQIQPEDAEVLRDGRWIRYDHASLVAGDIIRLVEGDVVPADSVVISLGMDQVDISKVINDSEEGIETSTRSEGDFPGANSLEMTVDSHFINGETKPRQIFNKPDGTIELTTLYYGSRVLEGSCIAVVTATGNETVLAQLIRDKKWPPKGDLTDFLREMEKKDRADDADVEAGIALLPR